MDHDDKEKGSPDWFAAWMKSAADLWLSAAKTRPASASNVSEGSQPSSASYHGKLEEGWQALLKTWQTSSSALSSPQILELILKGSNALPESAMRMARTTWDGYFQLYQMWLKGVGKLGEETKAYSFEGLEADTFKGWAEFYEKEIQPFLKAPPLGLTRFNQERANEAIDKFNQFQVAMAEFLHLLGLPVEKSLRVIQEKIEEQAKEGKLSENFKDYYNMWIKILEGHYMTLFKSPEYIRVLGRTVNVMEEYKAAREKVLADMLQFLPVAMNRDVDELYKEFYELKKTVKELANKFEKLESLSAREVSHESA